MNTGVVLIFCSMGLFLAGFHGQERIVIDDGGVRVQIVSMWGREVVSTFDVKRTEFLRVDVSPVLVRTRKGPIHKYQVQLVGLEKKCMLKTFVSSSRSKVSAMQERIKRGAEKGAFYEAHYCNVSLFYVAAVTFLIGLCLFRGILEV